MFESVLLRSLLVEVRCLNLPQTCPILRHLRQVCQLFLVLSIFKTFLDPETKNIIDKFAPFVAKNGPSFEELTRQKQFGNEKFSFLFGKENSDYYRYRVMRELEACNVVVFMFMFLTIYYSGCSGFDI